MKTRFQVTKLSVDKFQSLVHTALKEEHDVEIPDISKDVPWLEEQDISECRIREIRQENQYGLMVSGHDDKMHWQDTYLYEGDADKAMIFVEQQALHINQTFARQRPWKVPSVVKQLLWMEHGGMDEFLPVSSHAIVAGLTDVPLVVRLVKREVMPSLPVVYVSSGLSESRYFVNYEKLASELMGFAHVLVEGSPVVAKAVRKETDSKNPYDGAIRILYPTGEMSTLLPNTERSVMFRSVVKMVFEFWDKIYIDGLSFNALYHAYVREQLSHSCTDDETMALCDELLRQKDADLERMSDEVMSLKRKIYALESRSQWTDKENKSASAGNSLVLSLDEQEFYAGEFADVILRVLQKEYDRIKDDRKTGRSRKIHVLSSVLKNNAQTDTAESVRKVFIKATRDGTIDRSMMNELESAGFEIQPNKNRHYKVRFHGDDRYQTSVSTTPSDHRGAANLQAEFLNQLFGY